MAKRGPKQLPREERFWQRVDRSGECWLWLGAINHLRGGYGYFYDDGPRNRRAHVVAYEMMHGPVPVGAYVLHSCDTPACVRPDHLSVGDQATNQRQMSERGRSHKTSVSGSAHYKAVLNEPLVAEARRVRATGGSVAALARKHGVDRDTLGMAARGKTWRHVQ